LTREPIALAALLAAATRVEAVDLAAIIVDNFGDQALQVLGRAK
jgi:hypothetical protein